MNIELKVKFNETYLPTPRCRKLRNRIKEKNIVIDIKEATNKNAPIAFITISWDNKTEYRFWNDKLWTKLFWSENHGGKDGLLPISELHHYLHVYTYWKYNETEIEEEYKKLTGEYIIIDNILYKAVGEPRYVINTFGLGHNHSGTGMFIDTYYNSNIGKYRYFNALKRKEALEEAKKIALNRGDTESVDMLGNCNIEVLIPESVHCDPEIEHGDGDPFINKIENMINKTESVNEAGLLSMVVIANEINRV